MTDPISRPTPAITSDHGLAPIGAWAVHRAPGQGHEPPIWPGYQTIPPAAPPGLSFPTRVGPMPIALPPSQMPTGGLAPARAARRSRTADVALVLAAFVATAGVAFAIGRWSAPDPPSAAPMRAVSQLPAGVEPPAGTQLPSTVEPTAAAVDEGSRMPGAVAAVDEGSTTARADTAVAEPPAIDGGSDLRAGLPATGGSQGPPGAMAGFGAGGLQGVVSALEAGSLSLATEDGTIVSVATDASTSYVRETTIDAAEVAVGDLVSVELPFTGFRRQGDDTGDVPLIAEQVTLLPVSAD
jgi:hypothetical protein